MKKGAEGEVGPFVQTDVCAGRDGSASGGGVGGGDPSPGEGFNPPNAQSGFTYGTKGKRAESGLLWGNDTTESNTGDVTAWGRGEGEGEGVESPNTPGWV